MDALWGDYIWPGAIIVAQVLLIVVPLLFAVAYLTYAERKVIGADPFKIERLWRIIYSGGFTQRPDIRDRNLLVKKCVQC